ncbi:hypothetical protein [Porcipelethomonas sp.]
MASITAVIKKRYLSSHIILGEEYGLTKPSIGSFGTNSDGQ